mmetsp:Transcript_9631/g.24280  ORF Transcript_9631/g.24280 Transcript_9631/m.24280 type:complete len:514 (-) Transcript_9631:168-1709(-)
MSLIEAEALARAREADEARQESARSAELLASAVADVDGLLQAAENERNALIEQNEEQARQMAERLQQQQAMMDEAFERQQAMERRLNEQQRLLEAKLDEQRQQYEARVAQLEHRVSQSPAPSPRPPRTSADEERVKTWRANGDEQLSGKNRGAEIEHSPREYQALYQTLYSGRGLDFNGVDDESGFYLEDIARDFGDRAQRDTPPTRPPSPRSDPKLAGRAKRLSSDGSTQTPRQQLANRAAVSGIPRRQSSFNQASVSQTPGYAQTPSYSQQHARSRGMSLEAAEVSLEAAQHLHPAPPASRIPFPSRLPMRRGVSHGGGGGSGVVASPRSSLPAQPSASKQPQLLRRTSTSAASALGIRPIAMPGYLLATRANSVAGARSSPVARPKTPKMAVTPPRPPGYTVQVLTRASPSNPPPVGRATIGPNPPPVGRAASGSAPTLAKNEGASAGKGPSPAPQPFAARLPRTSAVAGSGLRRPLPVDARSKLSDAQSLLRANKENGARSSAMSTMHD